MNITVYGNSVTKTIINFSDFSSRNSDVNRNDFNSSFSGTGNVVGSDGINSFVDEDGGGSSGDGGGSRGDGDGGDGGGKG